ncbi:hypothetical protein HFO39_06730 [Rhizobium leguminosarum]|uniref:hypothetical protein n=1 Tax=Rhizobium leguminosarum TaxID=384 RepID=UPI001C9507F7|nr:hypothetical protein [Rhizobium leguminosarum]MBY5634485.1 hypothetical protein [Rhizobium leguminosarum]
MTPVIAVSGPFQGAGKDQDYPLAVDPGSAANMLVNVQGVVQMLGSYELIRNGIGAFIRINVPTGCVFEVRSNV